MSCVSEPIDGCVPVHEVRLVEAVRIGQGLSGSLKAAGVTILMNNAESRK